MPTWSFSTKTFSPHLYEVGSVSDPCASTPPPPSANLQGQQVKKSYRTQTLTLGTCATRESCLGYHTASCFSRNKPSHSPSPWAGDPHRWLPPCPLSASLACPERSPAGPLPFLNPKHHLRRQGGGWGNFINLHHIHLFTATCITETEWEGKNSLYIYKNRHINTGIYSILYQQNLY